MNNSENVIADMIVEQLKTMDVDGETMQYILNKVGMEDQMHRQLVMTMPTEITLELLKEKRELSYQKEEESLANIMFTSETPEQLKREFEGESDEEIEAERKKDLDDARFMCDNCGGGFKRKEMVFGDDNDLCEDCSK
jgi:hypothetical protein